MAQADLESQVNQLFQVYLMVLDFLVLQVLLRVRQVQWVPENLRILANPVDPVPLGFRSDPHFQYHLVDQALQVNHSLLEIQDFR